METSDIIKAVTGGLVTISIAEGFFGGIGSIIRTYNTTKPKKDQNAPNTTLIAVGSFTAGAATVLVAQKLLNQD